MQVSIWNVFGQTNKKFDYGDSLLTWLLLSLFRALDFRSSGLCSLGLFFSFILGVPGELLLFLRDTPGPALEILPPPCALAGPCSGFLFSNVATAWGSWVLPHYLGHALISTSVLVLELTWSHFLFQSPIFDILDASSCSQCHSQNCNPQNFINVLFKVKLLSAISDIIHKYIYIQGAWIIHSCWITQNESAFP